MLSARLQAIGFMTKERKEDADTSILKSAITCKKDGRSVITMAEDADILVLLMSHWREGMGDMVFGTDIKEKNKQLKTFFCCISKLVQSVTKWEILLFAHGVSECDTTSAVYQKGSHHVQFGGLCSQYY